MPGFKHLPADEKAALAGYLLNKEAGNLVRAPQSTKQDRDNMPAQVPYVMTGYHRFLDDDGYPGIKPPWGTLNAVDLNSGEIIWKVPLGEYEELTKQGIPVTGTENYGGPLVTKGGLVFIAATKDEKIRAFDKKTGRQVWQHALPAAGFATPATYFLNGRQYIVIACGGGKTGNRSGDTYMAFALP